MLLSIAIDLSPMLPRPTHPMSSAPGAADLVQPNELALREATGYHVLTPIASQGNQPTRSNTRYECPMAARFTDPPRSQMRNQS